MAGESVLDREMRKEQEIRLLYPPAPRNAGCCPEPHHAHGADPKAHRAHHWAERLKCAGFCLSLHVIYEVFVHLWHHAP